ncbi:MAG: methyltransferase [Bacteroidota bacterium]|nr:methyltransferase [Bacteroidota bacterium]
MKTEFPIHKMPPVWFIRTLDGFRKFLITLNKRLFPANVVLYEHFQYYWFLPCLKVAAELDIAGLLKDKAMTVEELAGITNSHPDSLFRILRALASMGVFRQRKDKRFVNTRLSKTMIDGKGSLRFMILQHLGKLNWTSFSELMYSVKTGKDAFSSLYGKNIYEYLEGDKPESSVFDKSMANLTEMSIDSLLSKYSFSGYPVIADIGGGDGILLSAILANNPGCKGILFDIQDGLTHAENTLSRYGIMDRASIIAGNFFRETPPIANAYILKNVLHNWDDTACTEILERIRKVMPDDGKILIIEMVIEENNRPSYGKLIDIQMLAFLPGGRERTRKEFTNLVDNAGLRIKKIIPTISPVFIIEIVKK